MIGAFLPRFHRDHVALVEHRPAQEATRVAVTRLLIAAARCCSLVGRMSITAPAEPVTGTPDRVDHGETAVERRRS
jgi:hypothetical protein